MTHISFAIHPYLLGAVDDFDYGREHEGENRVLVQPDFAATRTGMTTCQVLDTLLRGASAKEVPVNLEREL